METMVCPPMGGGVTKLYAPPTQSLGGTGLRRLDPRPGMDTSPDPVSLQQRRGCDPEELLGQCEEALGDRPSRFHRKFNPVGNGDIAPCSPIRVMQWNILAQALGEGLDSFVQCPPEALSWTRRKYLILEEILTHQPHILCLQEVDHYHDTLQPLLAGLGYSSNFCPKPWSPCLGVEGNNGPDGCALFFNRTRFELLDSVNVRLSAMKIPTNQVAVVTMLRCQSTGRRLCVAATHLKARSGWEWLRGAQGADLLQHVQNLIHKHAGASAGVPPPRIPLLICGDFNAVPSEEVYRRFTASPLRLDSAYKGLSPDGSTEPRYTTWKIRPTGECCATLDYIWYSRDALSVDAVLDLPTEEQIGPDRLPSFGYPSDHLSLVCDFSFKEQRGNEPAQKHGR
ncbi:nocturnin-like [Brachionichthys hirsutus]|uniref:nocturnin-like n=1 Tax=Brachionichthys hirsutus TaxID=412623 RepID=UPI003604F794